jgi:hypothetical protein
MKVLIACEESQTVCKAFREKGHEAYSCDIQDCSGGHPEWHIKDDAIKIVYSQEWDMMIAHPPCTYLTVTGNKWFLPKYKDRFPDRERERDEAIIFFIKLYNAPIDKIAIENPVGIMSKHIGKPSQIIQPYYFGHKEPKKTCLWLKNLNPLIYYYSKESDLFSCSNYIEPEYTKTKSGKNMATWYYYANKDINDPTKRSKTRSKTFPGIANAMADQWG